MCWWSLLIDFKLKRWTRFYVACVHYLTAWNLERVCRAHRSKCSCTEKDSPGTERKSAPPRSDVSLLIGPASDVSLPATVLP